MFVPNENNQYGMRECGMRNVERGMCSPFLAASSLPDAVKMKDVGGDGDGEMQKSCGASSPSTLSSTLCVLLHVWFSVI